MLGDAAHPMLQYIAQGACQALEDAVCFGESLSKHGNTPAALAAHQACRVKRTSGVQTTARRFGEIIHLADIVARDELLADRRSDDFSHFEWLYGYTGCGPSSEEP